MKRGLVFTIGVFMALMAGAMNVEAKRFGGGLSFGKQSPNVVRQATPPVKPAQPTQAAPQNAPQASPAAATAANAAARKPGLFGGRFGGMLTGLAAGLGLVWLASALGLSEAFGQVLLIALFAMLALMLFRGLARGFRKQLMRPSYAFQGANVGTMPSYFPGNVGNDASARPWEQGSMIGADVQSGWSIPAGFDVESFLKVAKSNFIHLQAAWDQADMKTLRAMMTDEMVTEISVQLAEREQLMGGEVNLTDVQMLQAQLLGIEDLGGEYMASVEFSGMIREDRMSGPSPFREVWNMTKPKDGSRGWLVAGVQALQ